MDWLKGWVRELAMLVLLAGLLDLLVPMGSMKRYVRMVMGLLVMVSLLNPVLAVWRAEVNLDEAFGSRKQTGFPSMGEVQAAAQRYRSGVQSQIGGQFRQQVEAQAALAARATEGVASAVAEASVEDGDPPVITGVRVYILPGEAAPGGSGAAAVRPVEPVRMGEAPRLSPGQDPVSRQARANVALALGLDPALVTVMVKED